MATGGTIPKRKVVTSKGAESDRWPQRPLTRKPERQRSVGQEPAIERYKKEEAVINLIRRDHPAIQEKLRTKYEKIKADELAKRERERGQKLPEREKTLVEKHAAAARPRPDKQERDEIQQLKTLQEDLRKREAQWTSTHTRLSAENRTLQDQVRTLEKFCLSPWKNAESKREEERTKSYGSDLSKTQSCALRETAFEERGQVNKQSAAFVPKPAPRTTLPPELVSTRPYLPPELPPFRELRMIVSAVSDDGVIHAMTLQAACKLEFLQEQMQEQMQQHIKTMPRLKRHNWNNVLGCAVMGSEMRWYRGHVQEMFGGYLNVRYVDRGTVENIPMCNVYPVVLCANVPQLCVSCQINGILPVGGTWQSDAVVFMKEMLIDRIVTVEVIDLPKDPRGLVTVEITLGGIPLSQLMGHQHAIFDPPIGNTEGLEKPPARSVYTDLRLPDKKMSCRVKIKHVRTPNEVYLSVVDAAAQAALEEAMSQANRDIASFPLLTDFPIGGPCLAESRDGKYYRAKLLGFYQMRPNIQLFVKHVDFGSDDVLPLCKLRRLPETLLHYPCAARYVRLAGFKPPSHCQESERFPSRPEWSMKAMTEMTKLLQGELRCVVMAEYPEPTVLLHDADGTLVHAPLVKAGLADWK